jgi:hypothetical protein
MTNLLSSLVAAGKRVRANPRLVGRYLNKLYYRATNDEYHTAGIDVFGRG